jgi:predicted amidohydrolase
MHTERVAEPPDGPTARFLAEQAARHCLWLAGSFPELPAGAAKPHNTLLVAGPGGEQVRYHKIHPFTYAGEDRHYQAGEERVTVTIEGLRLGLFVCYDLRFADEQWALAPEVDAYLVVANWPESRRGHWQALLTARAIENQAYVVGVNRVGKGGSLSYTGDSRIVSPNGEVLASAAEGETMLLADLDPAEVARVRAALPFLPDRRG